MDFFQIAKIAMKVMSNPQLRDSVTKIAAVLPEIMNVTNQLKDVLGPVRGQGPSSQPPVEHANAPHSMYPQGSIQWLQDALNMLGGLHLTVDGSYGEETREAVKAFQQKAGLEADGWAGPATTAAVIEALERK